MEKYKNQISKFADERLEEELWIKNGENTKYSGEIEELINTTTSAFGSDSDVSKLIYELVDLYEGEVYEMQNKAYRVGFKDGLTFEKVLSDI